MSTQVGPGAAVETLLEGLLDVGWDDGPQDGPQDGPRSQVDPNNQDDQVAAAARRLAAHRNHRTSRYGDLLGPLTLPAQDAEAFAQALTGADHGLRVLLAAPRDLPHEAARQVLRGARDLLVEQGVVELVGVLLGLPDGPSGQAAERLLDTLDFSAPAWVLVAPGPAVDDALRTLAEDGAEHLALDVDGADPRALAGTLRLAADLDLTFRAVGASSDAVGTATSPGPLRLLSAVRAALDGDPVATLTDVLAGRDPAPLVAALRRAGAADAAAARDLLAGVAVPSVDATVASLADLGLAGGPVSGS